MEKWQQDEILVQGSRRTSCGRVWKDGGAGVMPPPRLFIMPAGGHKLLAATARNPARDVPFLTRMKASCSRLERERPRASPEKGTHVSLQQPRTLSPAPKGARLPPAPLSAVSTQPF